MSTLEHQLEDLESLRDRKVFNGINEPMFVSVGGVLGRLLPKEVSGFLGLNACPAADNSGDLLVVCDNGV